MKKRYNLNFNFLVADIISQFNLGLIRRIRFVKVVRTPLAVQIFRILYNHGVIRTMRIEDDHILVYYKYIQGQPICKIKIVSRPGKRCY
jgi:ribosomal protein S8